MYVCMYVCMYGIAENVGGRKLWRIQLFRLFGGENFGEWPLPCATDLNGAALCLAQLYNVGSGRHKQEYHNYTEKLSYTSRSNAAL